MSPSRGSSTDGIHRDVRRRGGSKRDGGGVTYYFVRRRRMTGSVGIVAAGLVGLGAAGTAAAAGAATVARRWRPYLTGSHFERTHELRNPLAPLRRGYASLGLAVRLDADGV